MAESFFRTHFPPPSVLSMPVVGVDISDESIHAVRLERGHSGIEMDNVMRKTIDEGVMMEGKILDIASFTRLLKEFREEHKLHFVNVSLPEQHGYIFKMEVPHMRRSEVRGFIEMHIEEHVPIPVADAVFDYSYVQDRNKEDNTMPVSVSVYPRDMVEQYLQSFEDAGYSVVRLEIEAHGIARAIVPMGEEATVMILDLGKTRTGIFIVSGEVVQFSSTIGIGGDELTSAIMSAKDVTEEEAEEMKQSSGMLPNKDDATVADALTTVASVLRDEIQKRYTYWNTHNAAGGEERHKIESIALCGGNANLKGFSEYISEQVGIPVDLANVFVNVNSLEDYIPNASFEESLRYATAIGLSLKHH